MQVKNIVDEDNNKSLSKRSPKKTTKPIEKQITPIKEVAEVVEMKQMSSHSSAFQNSSSDEADIDDSQNR